MSNLFLQKKKTEKKWQPNAINAMQWKQRHQRFLNTPIENAPVRPPYNLAKNKSAKRGLTSI